MSEVLKFYQDHAKANTSSLPWLAALQAQGLRHFEEIGFPDRHTEDWKYTSLTSFLNQRFTPDCSAASRDLGASQETLEIPIKNGHVLAPCFQAALPKGMLVMPLSQALLEHADLIAPFLEKILKPEHAFHALNTAMLKEGVFVYLPKGVKCHAPLVFNHWQDELHQAAYLRHLIVLEPESQLTLVEEFAGEAALSYFTNSISEIDLATGATLTHLKMQQDSDEAYHMGHIAVRQAAGSRFVSHSMSFGGKLIRSDIVIDLNEPKATCSLNGIYAPVNKQHIDHHTTINHEAPDCESHQNYKGILNGAARAVFNGRVIVKPGAQHTVANQQNKNLLLSANTEIDTKPQLEIFADDVICTHGATVGQLDEEAIFYLATRGIDAAEARRALVFAFATENLTALSEPTWITRVTERLNQQLGWKP